MTEVKRKEGQKVRENESKDGEKEIRERKEIKRKGMNE